MKLVKNEVVSMDWNAEGFIETKKVGFISAVHSYGDVPVAFRDGKIYTSVTEDGVTDFKTLVDDIKSAHKRKDGDYPEMYDDYVEIFDGGSFDEDNVVFLGLAEYEDDMVERLNDLSGYWQIIETPMA